MRRLFKQFSFPGGIPEPRRARNARLDPRRRRARLLAVARVRRGVRQSGSDRRLRDRRRRSGDRPARDQLAFEQVSQSGARRRGAADPASERLQDRQPDGAGAHSARGADAAAHAATATSRSSSTRQPTIAATHLAMARTLDRIVERIREIQTDARSNGFAQRPRWPMLVLRTPKGWTGPSEVDGVPVEGHLALAPGAARRSWRRSRDHLRLLEAMDAQLSTRGAVHERRQAAARAARARAAAASGAWATTRTPTAACCCAICACRTSATTPSNVPTPGARDRRSDARAGRASCAT